jgi:uracil-DNA glycosylase family 4
MDARQEEWANPFGMDEECRNCPALCESRSQVVHGYGDVAADFAFVGEAPGEGPDRTGVPFTGDDAGELVQGVLADLGLTDSAPDSDRPEVDNVYLTYTARCHHGDREPTDEEVANCEPYLNGELRMINPEIIVPVGQRPLEALALEYTTRSPEELDVNELHATTIRGRGFEIVPMLAPGEQTPEVTEAFVAHMSELMGRDYRQTKGRRER